MHGHKHRYEAIPVSVTRCVPVPNMRQPWPQRCKLPRCMPKRHPLPTARSTAMPDPLLPPTEAAAYLHVSPRTLEKWRMHGGGPRYPKLVDRLVYTQQDLDAWVAEQTRTSTSDPGPRPDPPPPRAAVHALPPRRRRASRAKY